MFSLGPIRRVSGDEDCLYLNVYAPKAGNESRVVKKYQVPYDDLKTKFTTGKLLKCFSEGLSKYWRKETRPKKA